MKKRFTITYDIVTEESAREGDYEFNGYATKEFKTPRKRYIPKKPAKFTLREIWEFLNGISHESVECDSTSWSEIHPPRWINFSGPLDNDQESTSYSLHPAERGGITGASMCRIARLFRAYGESCESCESCENKVIHGCCPGAAATTDLNDWLLDASPTLHAPSKYLSYPRSYLVTACLTLLTQDPSLAESFQEACPSQD